jgi:hypothetical protein
MKYLALIGNCIASIVLYPVWLLWRNHEREVLSKAAVRCDGGEPGA